MFLFKFYGGIHGMNAWNWRLFRILTNLIIQWSLLLYNEAECVHNSVFQSVLELYHVWGTEVYQLWKNLRCIGSLVQKTQYLANLTVFLIPLDQNNSCIIDPRMKKYLTTKRKELSSTVYKSGTLPWGKNTPQSAGQQELIEYVDFFWLKMNLIW